MLIPKTNPYTKTLKEVMHRKSEILSCYEKAGDPSRAVNLYRAALSGPLREDTREEVENMLNACLVTLDHQPVKTIPSA